MQATDVFDYSGQAVRTVVADCETWFVAVDVCRILGVQNPTQAVGRLEADCVRFVDIIDALNRTRHVHAVNEPGLYELIFSSTAPRAKDFRRWVTSEVLPTIRKTGQYGGKVYQHPEEMMIDQARNMLAVRLETERLALEQTALSLRQDVAEAKIAGIESRYDWFTALAYAKRNDLRTERAYLSRVGKRASALCTVQGVTPGHCQDSRVGSVKMYPSEILEQAFTDVPR